MAFYYQQKTYQGRVMRLSQMWQKETIQLRYKIATMLLHIHKCFY